MVSLNTIDKIAYTGLVALCIDAVMWPILSGTGKTMHEQLGIPPPGDYRILGEITAQQAEQLICFLTTCYLACVRKYKP